MQIQVIRERHDTPESVQHRLTVAGGLNRFNQPNYRAVWGWNRLTPIGGRWEDRDANGNLIREEVAYRHEPKYPQVNRWHIEKWLPAEAYGSPADWELTTMEAGIPALGPYPSMGEYEHVLTVEGPKGEFLQLTPTIVEHIARVIETKRRESSKIDKRNRELKKEDDYVEWCMDQMSDTNEWSYTPHTYISAHLKEKMA